MAVELLGFRNTATIIAEMEQKLAIQAIKLAKLEQELQQEKFEKANLLTDFEHALQQLESSSYACQIAN